MDMQFFIETIKSGLAFGFMEIVAIGSIKELSARLKNIFKGQSLSEEKYTKVAEVMKEAYNEEKTEERFIDYLENSEELKRILNCEEPGTNVYQEFKGKNNTNIGVVKRDNIVNNYYKVDPEKK